MIQETMTYKCTQCGSLNLVKNGRTKKGKQKFRDNDCGFYGTINPEIPYTEEEKAEILHPYHERSSLRGLERTFGVSHYPVANWIKKADQLTPLSETLLASEPDNVLEFDELWFFVGRKGNKRWIWIALCRPTRQIMSYCIGDRNQESC